MGSERETRSMAVRGQLESRVASTGLYGEMCVAVSAGIENRKQEIHHAVELSRAASKQSSNSVVTSHM